MFVWRVIDTSVSSHYLLLRKGVVPHETTSDARIDSSGFAALRLRQRPISPRPAKASKSGGREPEVRVRRKLRVLVTLAVAAAAATFGVIDTKAGEISIHALKLEPQPQVDVEFGLLNTKPEPMISSL